jgi:inner membrane protein
MSWITQAPAAAWRDSRTLRLLAVCALGLVLNIPLAMIEGLVFDRQQRGEAAIDEITSRWGGAQTIAGPALVIPFTRFRADAKQDGAGKIETHHAVFLPRSLQVRGRLQTETRRRGIVAVPVYTLDLSVEGEFGPADAEELGIRGQDMEWERAALSVGISDMHALPGQPQLDWKGRGIAFRPGLAGLDAARDGIHASVDAGKNGETLRFAFTISLNGSRELMFVPFGEDSRVQLESNYAHPSFQGKWLPARREVSDAGFTADWTVSYLGRGYAQSWIAGTGATNAIEASRFGLRLLEPVDHYRMTERSVKYAILFVLLTFLLLWLIEVLAGIRVHPVQFLLVGAALCMFYLLELSLAEHVGFAPAYATASALVVALIGCYSAAVLHNRRRALAVAAACSGLYAYLYFLLANEDYSLLIGSLVLFLILAAVMYFTRRKDWYAVE